MNNLFLNWLSKLTHTPYYFYDGGFQNAIIRIEKNADIEYLFCQRFCRNGSVERDSNFEYAGIYCRKDKLLYDVQRNIYDIVEGDDIEKRSAEALLDKLKDTVRKNVEAAIGNDRSNLHITELTDSTLLSRLKYALEYEAKETARRRYLDTVDFEPPAFSCNYDPDRWKEDSLLAYIIDSEGYVEKEAEAFIAENQENMLFDFLYNDAVLQEYQAILEDKENPVHIIKKIMTVMKTTSAKTVNVTIFKDGTEFTFKTDASSLRSDCGNYYNSLDIVASDRRKFEELFGRGADYTPEEIAKITHSRKTLYEATY